MLLKISINRLLPSGKTISEILTEAELLLAFELGKYAKLLLGEELSLADIKISKRLLSSTHFSFVMTNNLNVGLNPMIMNLTDHKNISNRYLNPEEHLLDIEFQKQTEDEIYYNYEYNIRKNAPLHKSNRATAYVSLVARIMIESIRVGRKTPPKLIIDHKDYFHQEGEYTELFILQNFGNKILSKDILEIRYKDTNLPQPEWVAFVEHHRRQGLMNREYSISEKYEYLKKENFEIGDVVLYYYTNRNKRLKRRDKLAKITACYPAVIRGYDNKEIVFDYYAKVSTKDTFVLNIDRANNNIEDYIESITNDREKGNWGKERRIDLDSIGIGDTTYGEEEFLIKPIESDGSFQYFKKGSELVQVWLNTIETIYAVFEDRGIDYNKPKFLDSYLQNKVPIFEQYRDKDKR